MPAPGLGDSLNRAEIAEAAAAIGRRVGVEDFAPAPGGRQADAVMWARHRGEIDDDGHRRIVRPATTQPSEDRLVGVIDRQPLKAFRLRNRARTRRGSRDKGG